MVFYATERNTRRAVANAEAAVARRVDLYIQYHADAAANSIVADRLRAAGIRILAVNYPVADAPLYTADNLEAGRIARGAPRRVAARASRGPAAQGRLVGSLTAHRGRVSERARGVPG